MTSILIACSDQQVAEVARLAREIWLDHYVPIIGRSQVEYMLERFQSAAAVRQQVAGNYAYYLAERDGQSAGYLAVVQPDGEDALMLSKLYVRRAHRGQGVGREMLQFVEQLAHQRGASKVWLTVNKHNVSSLAWYLRMGFVNTGAIVQDIGGGFVMDDFKMEKTIS